jgi:hypothetical protein
LRKAVSVLTALRFGPFPAGVLTAMAPGSGHGQPAGPAVGTLRDVALRDVRRLDPAEDGGWWARDGAGRLWHIGQGAGAELVAEGLDPTGTLAVGHGRVAGRGLDGRLWVLDTRRPRAGPARAAALLAPQGGLCMLPLAVIAVVEHAGDHVLARFEAGSGGRWQVVARSREAVLPDAEPVAVDLDGRHGGAHIAVLAGPDAQRYPHAVLGDGIEATRVLWLERHRFDPLRSLDLGAPEVFEDRQLRPWRMRDGRTGLVAVRAGPSGAQLVVVAAARHDPSALEFAASGPAIGTRNRWLSPASVGPDDAEIWAVHTPHLGGVLHRYRQQGDMLVSEVVARGLTNHRLGERDLDISARVGRWLLLPMQDWREARGVDTENASIAELPAARGSIKQWVAGVNRRGAALLTDAGMAIWTP